MDIVPPQRKNNSLLRKRKHPEEKKNDCSAHVQVNLADDVGDGVQSMLIQ